MVKEIATFLRVSRRELGLLVLAFVVSLPAVTSRLYSSDEVQYFSYLRSLWFDGDVSFENEYRYFYERNIAPSAGFHETFLERQTAVGRRVNYATMGCALLWAPFYGVADAGVRVARALGSDIPVDGYSKPYVAAVAYGSAFYGFAAILLSIAAARRITGSGGGLAAGIAVWVGTPILFYMYVAPPFSHACSAFAVALFVTVWLEVRESWTMPGMVALGLAAALMTMVREQDAFFAVGPALDWILTLIFAEGGRLRPERADGQPSPRLRRPAGASAEAGVNRRVAAESAWGWGPTRSDKCRRIAPRQLVIAAMVGLVAFVVGYTPQLLAYNALNGYPGPAEHVARKMYWYAPHALQVLGSPSHGFLVWTPLAALAIAGLVMLLLRGDTRVRRIALCSLVMIAAQAYVAGSVASWTVAGAFGQRRFVAVTILLTIGLAGLFSSLARTPRRTVVAAVLLCAWWNVALMAQFALRLMDRQRLEPGRNAYHAFVTLPRLAPSLAYRYLFDRASFYQPAERR